MIEIILLCAMLTNNLTSLDRSSEFSMSCTIIILNKFISIMSRFGFYHSFYFFFHVLSSVQRNPVSRILIGAIFVICLTYVLWVLKCSSLHLVLYTISCFSLLVSQKYKSSFRFVIMIVVLVPIFLEFSH